MASNSRKSTEDLKQIVDSSNQDIEQMKLGLEKLRNLSKDDRTEAAMLRSRIDEQSSLIMMLKNRSDEYLRRVQVLERMNKDLEMCGQNANQELKVETKKAEMLERRFDELASNHQEMIKIKDEYKEANALLRRENDRLRKENESIFSQALADRDLHIKELEDKRFSLQKQCQSAEQKYRELMSESERQATEMEEKLKDLDCQRQNEKDKLMTKINDTENKLKDALSRLESEVNKQTDSESQYSKLNQEKEELLQLTLHRGKLIQDKQSENKNLCKQIEELKSTVKSLEERFIREANVVNTNKAVSLLRQELDKAEGRYKDIVNEYSAYKKHSKHLLDQERDLNEKLRHLAT